MQLLVHTLPDLLKRGAVLFDQVPLVHHDHQRPLAVVRIACHAHDLLGHAFQRVHHEQNDFRTLNRLQRRNNAVGLQLLADLGFAPDARRVHQHEILIVVAAKAVHRIPRGACDRIHNHPVFVQERIHQRGLSGVGLAHHGNPDPSGLVLAVTRVKVHPLVNHVQQFRDSTVLLGGNGINLLDAKLIELRGLIRKPLVVGFVGDHIERLVGP